MYDANAPGHQPVNADGCTQSYSYDELNRPIQSKDAQNNLTAAGYDLLGNRTAITDAEGRTTVFHYDDLGRLTETVDPLIETPTDLTQTFVYDEADNVIKATDRKGQVSRYNYDRLNRLTAISDNNGNTRESVTYDGFGDKIQNQNTDVGYTYTYNAKHQLTGKTDSRGGKTLSWTYDPVGHIDSKTDYQGDVTGYQYDSAGRLTAETNPNYLQVSYHYDPAGHLLDRILSNGAQTRYDYDAAGRLIHLKNTSLTGQLVYEALYSRDRIGNLLGKSEALGSAQSAGTVTTTIAYRYDPEYRLLSADYSGSDGDEAYTYDKVGNRKTYTPGGLTPNANTRYYQYDGNRLLDQRSGSATGTVVESYQYDANGSLTNISGNRSRTLTWDLNNRLKQVVTTFVFNYDPTLIGHVTLPPPLTSTFNYDPSGYRIKKAGSVNNNYYLEGEHLEAVYSDTGSVKAQYLRGSVIDEIVNGYQKIGSGKLINYTFHHDNLQSVLGQSGHEGSVLATQVYGAFGNIAYQTSTLNNALKYTGREQDDDTGFYYYRARYYDPATGRFISEDPMGFGAGGNFYAYVNNNPVNGNDPSGELPLPIVTGSIGFVAGAVGSAAGQVIEQLINNGSLTDFSLKNVGIAAGVGFAAGAAAPSTAKTLLGSALSGSVSNVIQYGITQAANGQNFNTNDAISNGVTGFFGGALGGSVGRATGLRYSEYSSSIDSGLAYRLNNNMDIQVNTGANALFRNFAGAIASGLDLSSFNFGNGASASGGFLLYPNKTNTNMMQSVYSK